MNLLKRINDGEYDFEDEVVYIPEKKSRKRIMTKATAARAKEILTASTTATLDTAREVLAEEGIEASRATIYRMTVKENISVQMVTPKPGVVFTQKNVNKRLEYARQVDPIPDEELWFIDESGFNLHLAPLRCWSEVGHTPVQPVPANRGQNVSLLMCISLDGIMYYQTQDGAYNAEEFAEFLEALADHFPQVHDGQVTLVMDNAPIHHAAIVRDFLTDNGIKHLFLPPYSPDLNPIENVFGMIKRRYRKQGVVNARDEIVDRIANIIGGLNDDDDFSMAPFYDRMRGFVERALNSESFD